MTTVFVRPSTRGPELTIEGELEGYVSIAEGFKMRVIFSDGSIVHFGLMGGCYKVFILCRGPLLDVISVGGDYSDSLMFRKGLRWAFASSKFYEILCKNEKEQSRLKSKMITCDNLQVADVHQYAN